MSFGKSFTSLTLRSLRRLSVSVQTESMLGLLVLIACPYPFANAFFGSEGLTKTFLRIFLEERSFTSYLNWKTLLLSLKLVFVI